MKTRKYNTNFRCYAGNACDFVISNAERQNCSAEDYII